MNLNELRTGQYGIIRSVGGEGALRQHFLDMGVIPGIKVKVEKLAPMGDPMELLIHGYELTLRQEEVIDRKDRIIESKDARIEHKDSIIHQYIERIIQN